MPRAITTQSHAGLTTTRPEEIGALLELLRKTAEDHGGMSIIAKKSGLSREALYRALSSKGNPTIKTLASVLSAVGMSLTVNQVRQESVDDRKK